MKKASMHPGTRFAAWGQHIAIATLYAATYVALRHIGGISWVPLAGLRLACLLLMPYRYWPALLVGEMLPLAYINYEDIDTSGVSAFLSITLPPLGVAMPVVAWMRKHLPAIGQPIGPRIGAMLICSSLLSVLWSLNGLVYYALLKSLPLGESPITWNVLSYTYFLALSLGILVVVPPVLALAQSVMKAGSWQLFLRLLPYSRLLWHSAILLAVMSAMITTGIHYRNEELHSILLIAFFVPVIFFALRHGWHGAAVAGSAANVGIVWIMPAWNDHATMMAQTILVLAMITFLMLGQRTSVWKQSLLEIQESLLLARQELYLNELKMRHSAQELEHIHYNFNVAHGRLMTRMRPFMRAAIDQSYREQFVEARRRLYRLADSLSPREWQRAGRPITLWTGPIAEVLEEVGVIYDVDIHGDLHRVGATVNMALYRLGCEAVTHLMAYAPTDRLALQVSAKEVLGGFLVELTVSSDGLTIDPPKRETITSGLGATGLSEEDMRNRARLYHGDLQIEKALVGARIHVHLTDLVEGRAEHTR